MHDAAAVRELYQDEWASSKRCSIAVARPQGRRAAVATPVSGARVAALYRRACEHLALARARSYPPISSTASSG